MSEILKTEAVVLNKINYGDTSSIVSLFTEDYGKLSVIVKGARSPKSKYGKIVDPVNHLHIVFYKKDTREVQLISSADIVDHFPKLKNDLDKIKYAYAILELVKALMAEHEANKKIFKGIVRILTRLDTSNELPEISFGRFFVFFLKEIGYEIQIEKCAVCGRTDFEGEKIYYNFDKGLICGKCRKEAVDIYDINVELLHYLQCLKTNEIINNIKSPVIQKANMLLEHHLKYHVPDFKGIQSLKLFNEG
jgi:DNA repair protein RecO (recombination protein O)